MEKGVPLTLLVGMQVGAASLENSVKILQEIKNRTSLWPCHCTPGYLPQRYRCSEKKGHQYPNVYSSNGHGRQTVERTKMPFNRWMDKEDVVHVHYGVLCLHQKGLIPNFCSNMDGTGRDYAEWNKLNRESIIICFHLFVEHCKKHGRYGELERRGLG